jgi:hypothetical protein
MDCVLCVLNLQVGWLTTEFNKTVLLGYDYAISGSAVDTVVYEDGTVEGYIKQVTEDFVPFAGREKDVTWTTEAYLFGNLPSGHCRVNSSLVDWD